MTVLAPKNNIKGVSTTNRDIGTQIKKAVKQPAVALFLSLALLLLFLIIRYVSPTEMAKNRKTMILLITISSLSGYY